MSKTLLVSTLVLAVLLQTSLCIIGPSHLVRKALKAKGAPKSPINPEFFNNGITNTPYNQAFHSQILDHFNYGYGSPSTLEWNMRYLYSEQYWGGAESLSPIFVYCGNEGDITSFWNNSGYMVDVLAPQYKAYLLFPEHRYFGESFPFGEDSFNGNNLDYLTSDQALADYAIFIRYYKTEVLNCVDCPVITFGGSYGGMLSAWMRMKYPSVVDGSWAASAPLLYFDGVTPYEAFNEIVTWDFGNSSAAPQCADVIKEGFNRLDTYMDDSDGDQYQVIDQAFNLCTSLGNNANIANLEGWIETAYTYMAMVDYPYPTSFLTPMPGYPVNFSCQAFIGLNTSSSDQEIFTAMYLSSKIYYDYQNITNCTDFNYDPTGGTLGMQGWDVLACTQVILPMGSNGVNDFFPPQPWSYSQNSEYCEEAYNVQCRYDWALNEFGGWDAVRDFSGYSNIFFSNGLLDPWHAGGVLVNISESVVAYVIEGSAHHLDLRLPNPLDPPSVTFVRKMEAEYIGMWVQEKQSLVKSRREKVKEISS